ncbi:MAG: ABC transporter permease [Clostridiaceae bacterium]|jgi:simple sugar transport system permease protein|nr:ABC transporter permease [Clostridiaceae bacterium]
MQLLNTLLLTLSITLMYSSPLIFTALGGVITQRSGVDNIGLEGMMAFGACGGSIICYFTGSPWIGLLAGATFGAILALLHAFVAITAKGNQIISGIAINFIGAGVATFLTRFLFSGAAQSNSTINLGIPKLFELLGIDKSKSQLLQSAEIDITVIIAFMFAILIWFVLYKTKTGLRVRACGEHPGAADTLGINVSRIRYICTILSGVMAGLGGAVTSLAISYRYTPTVITGQGFIALAAVIFGNWKPIGATMACLLFGFAQALTVVLAGTSWLPSQILAMLPYALTLFMLVIFVSRSRPPKALGQPYFKGQA